jgi:hypothetical protein
MQNVITRLSHIGLFDMGIDSRTMGPAAKPASIPAAAGCAIPEPFTPYQAEWIIALHRLHGRDRLRAMQILWDRPGAHRCSHAQALCIQELLGLDSHDMLATLADAMEDCRLRDSLRARLALTACAC